MLNEDAYQSAREKATRLGCPFEKALLSRCADCENAEKHNIAEREAVSCRSAIARENCHTLRALLHQNAMFVLKLAHLDEPLPHAKDLKVQCGGLLGLQRIFPQVVTEQICVSNIHQLVLAAHARFGSLQDLPYNEIVQSIAAYEARRRR